jgi:glycosyltransferase involved in cell wall biosynthesis
MNITAPVTCERARSEGIAGRRLAYLLSSYPAVSHTFFLNEICQLRKLGFAINVASINTPDRPRDGVTARETDEVKDTLYIKATKPAKVAALTLKILLTDPRAALRGLAAALRLDPWSLKGSAYALAYLLEALILGDWLRRHGHDHLHVHFGGPVATVGMLTSITWKIPYSLTIHGPDEFYNVKQSYLREKVERAQFVICISDYCRSQIMKISNPSHWSKLRVVRLGVDPEIFAPQPSAQQGAELEIICVGRLAPTKGQLVLLRAIAELLHRGHRLRLRLVGDGVDRPRLEEFISEQGLGASVILEGARNHEATRKLLGHADIFVLASFAEGLPVALMEAMAMEVPCVSTYVAGIPELIRDGLDGLLVPPSSHHALAGALERLIDDANLRRSLAASGRLRVLEFYNLERNVRTLAATLEEELPKLA